jgi:hypothetical protein
MEGIQFYSKEELLKKKLSELVALHEQISILPPSEENSKYLKLITSAIAIKGDDIIQ